MAVCSRLNLSTGQAFQTMNPATLAKRAAGWATRVKLQSSSAIRADQEARAEEDSACRNPHVSTAQLLAKSRRGK
jgi:hypothetical protein